jgi:hypothetical protein
MPVRVREVKMLPMPNRAMADAPATVQASAIAHQPRRGKVVKAENSSAPALHTMATPPSKRVSCRAIAAQQK